MPDFSARYYNPDLNNASPLPYYLQVGETLKEVSSLTDKELESLGWFPLRVMNDDYDPEIQYVISETVDKLSKTITYNLSFLETARDTMLRKIDEQAEARRALIATSAPLQTMEYQEAYRQALAFKANPTNDPDDWPFLKADLGRTLLSPGVVVKTLDQAADAVITAQKLWLWAAAVIRDKRLAAKAAIRDASTIEAAFAAYKAAWD